MRLYIHTNINEHIHKFKYVKYTKHISNLDIYIINIYAFKYLYHIQVYMYTYIDIHTNIRTSLYMYIHMNTYIRICAYINIDTYIYV
jgi:hypothetical protein